MHRHSKYKAATSTKPGFAGSQKTRGQIMAFGGKLCVPSEFGSAA